LRLTFSKEEYALARKSHSETELGFLKTRLIACPVEGSIAVLAKKWTLFILWDLGAYKVRRFNELMRLLPGVAPKVLSARLKELEGSGFIARVEERNSRPAKVRWALTAKGRDFFPFMMMLVAFESKWHPDVIFEDGQPRKLHELFSDEAMELINSSM
jgi:DNA-binding HxlR family transcriptional regulator